VDTTKEMFKFLAGAVGLYILLIPKALILVGLGYWINDMSRGKGFKATVVSFFRNPIALLVVVCLALAEFVSTLVETFTKRA
jgi:hypothetical protein